MSRENVELFERAVEAWNRGDIDAMFAAVWSPDVEFDMTHYEGWPEEPTTGNAMMRFAQLATVEDGRIVRIENYSDRETALEAIGLRE